MENAPSAGMSAVHEQRAARSLRLWLRRAALAAIPAAGLVACGNDGCGPDVTVSAKGGFDGGVAWTDSSRHTAAECLPYCYQAWGDSVCEGGPLVGCRL